MNNSKQSCFVVASVAALVAMGALVGSPSPANAKAKKASKTMLQVRADAKQLANSAKALKKQAKGKKKAVIEMAIRQLDVAASALSGQGGFKAVLPGPDGDCTATADACGATCSVVGSGTCSSTNNAVTCTETIICGNQTCTTDTSVICDE